jgi:hypothetical protein
MKAVALIVVLLVLTSCETATDVALFGAQAAGIVFTVVK